MMHKKQILETIQELKKPHQQVIQQYKEVDSNDIIYYNAVEAIKVYESIERQLLIS